MKWKQKISNWMVIPQPQFQPQTQTQIEPQSIKNKDYKIFYNLMEETQRFVFLSGSNYVLYVADHVGHVVDGSQWFKCCLVKGSYQRDWDVILYIYKFNKNLIDFSYSSHIFLCYWKVSNINSWRSLQKLHKK